MKFDKKEPAIGKKSGRNTPGTEKKVCKAIRPEEVSQFPEL